VSLPEAGIERDIQNDGTHYGTIPVMSITHYPAVGQSVIDLPPRHSFCLSRLDLDLKASFCRLLVLTLQSVMVVGHSATDDQVQFKSVERGVQCIEYPQSVHYSACDVG
jgi:hypothetical protein